MLLLINYYRFMSKIKKRFLSYDMCTYFIHFVLKIKICLAILILLTFRFKTFSILNTAQNIDMKIIIDNNLTTFLLCHTFVC